MKRLIKGKKENKRYYNIKIDKTMFDYSIVKRITYKALKVIYSSSKNTNQVVIEMLEGKRIDTLEDLQQNVALKVLETGYKIDNKIIIKNHVFRTVKNNNFTMLNKKDVFRSVNNYIYNIKKREIRSVELFVENDKINEIERISYMQFITKKEDSYNQIKFNINDLNLTQKQCDILNMYTKLNSTRAVAEMLGVHHSYIDKTLKIIREKTKALLEIA